MAQAFLVLGECLRPELILNQVGTPPGVEVAVPLAFPPVWAAGYTDSRSLVPWNDH